MILLSCQIMITVGKLSDNLHLVEEVDNRDRQVNITQVQQQEEECTDCQRLMKEVIKILVQQSKNALPYKLMGF